MQNRFRAAINHGVWLSNRVRVTAATEAARFLPNDAGMVVGPLVSGPAPDGAGPGG
jgi:hypothetical protein